jgi:N-acetylmuramoyl-L-alanine amidase
MPTQPTGDPPLHICFDYDKAAARPPGYGYDARPAVPLIGTVWHSTEHSAGQSYAAVCAFLRDSPDVSAHYVVGEDGTVQRILDPGPWRAWHAGASNYQGLRDWNNFAVGVEIYHRAGTPYPAAQRAACTALGIQLMQDHPTILHNVTHRAIAIPPGRKADPTDWSDADFAAWAALLANARRI